MTETLLYRVSPAWKITQVNHILHLHGGADAEYTVELAANEPSHYTKRCGTFTHASLSTVDAEVFDQLFLAGVIELVSPPQKTTLRVGMIGDELPFALQNERLTVVDDIAAADMVLVRRHTSWHGEIIKKTDYYTLETPHLYVDMAYHHTVSLGPLVYPEQTACIGCLYGRLRERWGDEKPPDKPNVTTYAEMIRTWLERELKRIADGDMSLVGKTVSWDMDQRAMQQDILLRSTACPRCGDHRRDGKIVLD